jgi:hypothetical protein
MVIKENPQSQHINDLPSDLAMTLKDVAELLCESVPPTTEGSQGAIFPKNTFAYEKEYVRIHRKAVERLSNLYRQILIELKNRQQQGEKQAAWQMLRILNGAVDHERIKGYIEGIVDGKVAVSTDVKITLITEPLVTCYRCHQEEVQSLAKAELEGYLCRECAKVEGEPYDDR